MTTWAIRTEGLTRDFKTVRAVDALTLDIAQGTIFGFLGPNGAGKSTTIRLLLGLLAPTAGRAEVLGYDTRTDSAAIREQSGALLEHTGLYERLTAYDNLEFYARAWNLPPTERAARIQSLLNHFGLWDRRGETVNTWSKGMKQKLAIARAMLHHPTLLFVDEPTAGLDPVAAAALRDDLAALVTREGVTVFLTTHNLTEAEKLCSRVAVIRSGRLLSLGAPNELRSGDNRVVITGSGFDEVLLADLKLKREVLSAQVSSGSLILKLQDGAPTAPLITELTARGVCVEEVHKEQASLEEVFLALVEEQATS